MFFNLDLDSVSLGLNVDPLLILMSMQAETPEELESILDDIERDQDRARDAARRFKDLSTRD
jgi:hypothetical protein